VEETGVPGYKNRHQHHLIQNNLITYYRNDVAQKFSNGVKQLLLKHLNIGYISFKNHTVNTVTYHNFTISYIWSCVVIWSAHIQHTTKDQKSYIFAQITMQQRNKHHKPITIHQRTKRATVSHIQQCNNGPKELRFRTYHNTTKNQKSYDSTVSN
jgi:hypothetical protein